MNKLILPIVCFYFQLFVLIGFLPAQYIPKKFLPETVNPALASDSETRIDVNNIDMFVTNYGSIAQDESNGTAGFCFPKGSNLYSIFHAGLSVGAMVDGELRVAVAYYDEEFGPGTIEGGNPSDPEDPRFRVYKITTGDGPGTPDWDEWPFSDGAPDDGSGNPRLFGDQTLWAVFNDADPARHTSNTGGTDPLCIEVQLTVFAYRWPTSQANTIYLKYRIINKGSNILEDTYFQFWQDPDLGQFQNDFAGFDTNFDMGYCYNADKYDEIYQAVQPAIGCVMLQGPETDGGGRMVLSSFIVNYQSGNRRPENAQERYNIMQGLNTDGADIIDPSTSSPTKFMFSGDPLSSTGWIDEYYEDKTISINSGPFTMAPGDTQEVIYAMMVGQGEDHLNSIEILRAMVPEVENLYNAGFPSPNPPAEDAAAVCIHQPAYGVNIKGLIPSATVAHLGSGTESFNVNYIVTLDGAPEYQSTRATSSLSAGNTEYIEFDNWFPSDQGIFDVELSVSLAGDADNTNDILQTTIEITNPPAPINLHVISRTSGEAVLGWDPPPDYSDILGYNIYRSNDSGGPYTKLNSTFVTELTYTDYTIPNDVVFYVVSYETSTGFESYYSNELVVYPVMIISDENILLVNGVSWDTYGQQIIDFYEKQMTGTNVFDFWDLFTDNPVGFIPVGEGQAPPWDLFQQYKSVIWIGNNYQGDLELWNESLAALKQYMLYGGNVLLATRLAENFFDDDLRTNYAHIDNWSEYYTIEESNPLVALIPGLTTMGSGNGSTESTHAQMFMESSEILPDNITTFVPSFEFDDLQGTIWKAGFRSELAGGGQFAFIAGRPYRFDENVSRENYNYILENWFGHPEYSKEMLVNGDFELGIDPWFIVIYDEDAIATFDIDESGLMQGQNSAHLTIDQTTNTNWHIQLRQYVSVSKGRYYIIKYQARANQNTTVETWLQQDHDPWFGYAVEEIQLTTDTQTFTDTAIVDQDDTTVLAFMVGNSGLCEIWFDSVSVVEKVGTFDSSPVTFQADLTNFIAAGWFDPANPADSIVINGDFNAWNSQDKMIPDPGDANIYQYTTYITKLPGDIIQWKFRLFPEDKWQNSGWDMGDNRKTTFTGEDIVLEPIEPNVFPTQYYVWKETEDYYPIIIENITLDGQPIEEGDEVGVFFRDDNDFLVCGGATIWPNTGFQAWGDDSQTPEKDGFVIGEELVFRLWDASDQAEWGHPFNVVYVAGDGNWGTGPFAQISLMEFRAYCSITLELTEGWNWISINVDPFVPSVVDMWAPITCLEILKSYTAFYVPGIWDGIGDWDYKQMYTAYLSCAQDLYIEGRCLYPPEEPIPLNAGWNWISYLPDHPIDIWTALASIIEYIIIVKGPYGFFVPDVWDGIGDMEPGKGYKILPSQECTLIYPADGALAKRSGSEKTAAVSDICTHFSGFKTTEDYQAILIQSINANSIDIAAGDELGIFTESGICVGGVVLTASYPLGMMAWMDDSRTDVLDGFKTGEKMAIKYWNASADKEYHIKITLEDGSERLGESALIKVSLEVDLLSSIAYSSIPTIYSLDQNYPNPFNPATTIHYGIPEAGHVSLTIYSLDGKLVKRLENTYKNAGFYQIEWDGTNASGKIISSGVYIYRMEAGNFSSVRKMIFVK